MPRGREDYVDPAGFRAMADEVDRLERAMAPWPIWIRSLAQIAFLLAAFAHRVRRCIRRRRLPAAGRLAPEPRQERCRERGPARPQSCIEIFASPYAAR